MGFDRLIHVGAALALWWGVGRVRRWRGERAARAAGGPVSVGDAGAEALAEVRASWGMWAMLPGVLLGASLPDWDLWFGIGFHRSPLFHSALPVIVVAGMLWLLGKRAWLRGNLLRGLAVGVASHLLWDIVQYGDVRWIKGGNADRLFLFANAAALVAWACLQRSEDDAEGGAAATPAPPTTDG